jgi:hypothetical protein
MFIEHYPIHLN